MQSTVQLAKQVSSRPQPVQYQRLDGVRLNGSQFGVAQQQVEQGVVVEFEQLLQGLPLGGLQSASVPVEKAAEDEIIFQQPAPRTPTDAAQVGCICGGGWGWHAKRPKRLKRQTARRNIKSLMLPMALVGLSPLGQTSTQFMMV